MTLLAFDLATNTGWAVGDREPVMGSRRLGDGHAGCSAGLIELMNDLIDLHNPELILFERPIRKIVIKPSDKIKITPDTIYRLSGLAFVCEGVARTRGKRCEAVNLHTARASFLGKGLVPRGRDKVKAAVIEGCRLRGWQVENDDEADAACVWASHARDAVGSPLFARSR